MKQTLILAFVAVVLGAPGGLFGQRPPRTPQPPHPPVPPRGWGMMVSDHHGRIGVLVNTDADPATDSVGARVEGVTPGGPAAKAGLKAGDVILKFHGTALGGVPADEDGESGPGHKLVELARALEPGDTVQVEYRRGTEKKKTTLVAAEVTVRPGMDRAEMPFDLGRMPLMGGPEGHFSICFGEAWCDMELVSLNADLGEYFGTKEGILVVKAPADSSLPLKGGDVILSIGGRKPTSASHAMRILRSYDAGETVSIDVMRKQKRTSVTWQVPKPEGHMRQFMRLHQGMHADSDDDLSES